MKRISIFLFAVLFSLQAHAATVNIVCLGDSNTSGALVTSTQTWPHQLGTALSSAYPYTIFNVVNQGVSGQNSPQLIAALSTQLGGQNPDIVVVMTGTNDAYALGYTWTGDPNNCSVDPNITLTDVNAINAYDGVGSESTVDGGPYLPQVMSYIQSLNSRVLVVFVTPFPAASYPDQINGTTIADWCHTRPTRNLTMMRDKLIAYAQANGLPYVNAYDLIHNQSGWLNQGGGGYLIQDGVHGNATCYGQVASAIVSALTPTYIDSNGLPLKFWRRVTNLGAGGKISNLGVSGKIGNLK